MTTTSHMAAILACLISLSIAHMQLVYPAPFNASNNPHRTTDADPFLQYPYDCCGPNDSWTYPCRGYLSLLGTDQGAPTATWAAGSQQFWNIGGIGNHYGGSCQVGFSTDDGQAFHVATSYEGNCPHRDGGDGPDGQKFEVWVPEDLEPGIQIFAWIWYNREQEFNMNCAAVEITSGSASPPSYPNIISTDAEPTYLSSVDSTPSHGTGNGCTCSCQGPIDMQTCNRTCSACSSTAPRDHRRHHMKQPRRDPASMAFKDRPLMFVADDGNGCLTPLTTAELQYPDPGPNVVMGDGAYPLALPTGSCGASEMLSKQGYDGATGNDGH